MSDHDRVLALTLGGCLRAFETFLNDELTLFPRNVGMGTSTTAARIGSFLSPYVVYSVSNSNAKEIY